MLGLADGSITELFETADWDGLVRMHDVELVGGRQLLLVSLVLGSDQPDTSTEAIYVVDLATAERTELHAGVGSVRSRLTMAPSGLVVGEVADDAGVSFLALAVPGSPAAQEPLPTAEQLGLQATYPGCDVDCPRMYTVLPDGTVVRVDRGLRERRDREPRRATGSPCRSRRRGRAWTSPLTARSC